MVTIHLQLPYQDSTSPFGLPSKNLAEEGGVEPQPISRYPVFKAGRSPTPLHHLPYSYTTDNSFVPPIYRNHSPIGYVHRVVGTLLGILNRAMPILLDGLEPQLSLH